MTLKIVYLYILLTISILHYSCNEETSVNPSSSTPKLSPAPVTDVSMWSVYPMDYEHLMTIVAAIKVNGEIDCSSDNKIAAFSGSEVRGIATPYNHLNCTNYNLIVYSNALDENITFGIYIANKDTAVISSNEITFKADSHLGMPDSSYVINIE